MKRITDKLTQFISDETGMGTLEVLLIVAILVAIALLFREKIIDWVSTLLEKSDAQIDQFSQLKNEKV
jgi:Flp pilus assembly pilin Flp